MPLQIINQDMMFDKLKWVWFPTFIILGIISSMESHLHEVPVSHLRLKRETGGTCPRGRYMDKGTGHCDLCSPHCHRTNVNPPSGCQIFCQQMTESVGQRKTKDTTKNEKRCQEGFYFDTGTTNCDLCLPYCKNHLEEPPGDCLIFCNQQVVTTTRSHEPLKSQEPESTTNPRITWLAVGLCASIVVVAVIGLVAVFKPKSFYNRRNNGNKNDEQRVPFRPGVAENTQEGERTSELVTNIGNSVV